MDRRWSYHQVVSNFNNKSRFNQAIRSANDINGYANWDGEILEWSYDGRYHYAFTYSAETKTFSSNSGIIEWKAEGGLVPVGNNKNAFAKDTCQIVGSVPSPVCVIIAMMPYLKGLLICFLNSYSL